MAEITITARAAEVLRRGLATARLDPAEYGVRIRVLGGATRTAFAAEPEAGDQVVDAAGVRVFVDRAIAEREAATIDVTPEHDQIVVRS